MPDARVVWLVLSISALGGPCGYLVALDRAVAEPVRPSDRSQPAAPARDLRQNTLPAYLGPLPRARPDPAERADEPKSADEAIARPASVDLPEGFRALAKLAGEPQIPGSRSSISTRSGIRRMPTSGNTSSRTRPRVPPARHAAWRSRNRRTRPSAASRCGWKPTARSWSTAETAIPTHGDGANRNDNKYIDNSKTYRTVIRTNSIGVEFVGNFPDVAKPVSAEQTQAWLILVRFLQERYDIPPENIYAHNWIDYKDHRYCEGCELATLARKLAYQPGKTAAKE